MKKKYSLLFIVFLGWIGGFLFVSCENSIEKINQITAKDTLPSESLFNFEVIQSEFGIKTYKLNSPHLNRYIGKNSYEEFPDGVKIEIYDSTGSISTTMTCKYALKKTDKNIIEGRYNVILINAQGEKLETEYLVYDEKKDQLFTDQFVTISTKNEKIRGNGLVSNSSFTKYKITQPVGKFIIDEE